MLEFDFERMLFKIPRKATVRMISSESSRLTRRWNLSRM